ncbi:MAG: hypothetical protein E7179_03370 [Erysipelotrichaceae bacterium]|jgi:iron complex transport system substrate-binding protein|nr:hypothetical protein [Erysipelotrichaceae bacterium]
MKKVTILLSLAALLASCGGGQEPEKGEVVTDMIGREVRVIPGSYKKVVCIGAGALRLYSYVGDVDLLAGVEDIDNETLSERPKMFDGVARPYVLANGEKFKTLPSCGVGGPNAQTAEAEKILSCKPDIVISEYEDVEKENALQKQLGVPVITLKCGSGGLNNDSALGTYSLLGKIFGKQERAKQLSDFIAAEKKALSDRTASIAEEDKVNAYVCGLGNWGTTNQYMTAQNYDVFNTVHINNVVTGLPKDGIQPITAEKFASIAADMDLMIFDAAAVKNIRGKGFDFSQCAAFQTGEVYLQMAYNAYYTNLETALINAWFTGKAAYPSLFADVDIAAKADEITEKFNGKKLYEQMKGKPQSFGGYQKIANPTEFFK